MSLGVVDATYAMYVGQGIACVNQCRGFCQLFAFAEDADWLDEICMKVMEDLILMGISERPCLTIKSISNLLSSRRKYNPESLPWLSLVLV